MDDRIDELLLLNAETQEDQIERHDPTSKIVEDALNKYRNDQQIEITPQIVADNVPEILGGIDVNKVKGAEAFTEALGIDPVLSYGNYESVKTGWLDYLREVRDKGIGQVFDESAKTLIERRESGHEGNFWTDFGAFKLDVWQAWENGWIQKNSADLGWEMLIKGLAGEDFSEKEATYDKWQSNRVDVTGIDFDDPKTFTEFLKPRTWVMSAVEMAPMMLKAIEKAAPVGFAGASVGMISGAAIGAPIAGVGAVPGAVSGGALGLKAGMKVGMYNASMQNEAGLAFAEFIKIEDGDKNRLDPKIAATMALGAGAIAGALEVVSLGMTLKTVPGLKQLLSKSLKEATEVVVKRTTLQVTARGVGNYAKYVGLETAQEIGQEFAVITMLEFSKIWNNAVKGTRFDNAKVEEIVNRLLFTGLHSAGAFIVMGGPGNISSTISATAKQGGIQRALCQMEEKGLTLDTGKMYANFMDELAVQVAAEKDLPENYNHLTTINNSITDADYDAPVFFDEVNNAVTEQQDDIIEMTEEEVEEPSIQPAEYAIQVDETIEAYDDLIEAMEVSPEVANEMDIEALKTERAALVAEREQYGEAELPEADYIKQQLEQSEADQRAASEQAAPVEVQAVREGITEQEYILNQLDIEAGVQQTQVIAEPKESITSMDAGRVQSWGEIGVNYAEANRRLDTIKETAARVADIEARLDLAKETTDKMERARIMTGQQTMEEIVNASYITPKKAFSAGKQSGVAQEKATNRVRRYLEKQKSKAKAVRDKIKGLVKKLGGMKLAPELKEAFDSMSDSVDLKKRSKGFKADTDNIVTMLESSSDVVEIPTDMIENVKVMGQKNIYGMTIDEANYFAEVLDQIKKAQYEKNRVRTAEGKQWKADVIDTMLDSELRPEKELAERIERSTKGKMDFKALLDSGFRLGQLHYDLLIEIIAGRQSAFYEIFYKNVKDGITIVDRTEQELTNLLTQEKHKVLGAEVNRRGTPVWKNTEIDNLYKWGKEESDITVYIDNNEHTIPISRQERMTLYQLSKNKNTRRSILEAGIGIPGERQLSGKVLQLGENKRQAKQGLDAILGQMTPEEIQYAETWNIVAEEGYTRANTVHLEKNGFELDKEDNYFPTSAMPEVYGKTQDEIDVKKQFGEHHQRIGIERGFLNTRTKGAKALLLEDHDKVVSRHIRHLSTYVGLEIPLSDAGKIMYDGKFRNTLKRRYGTELHKHIENGLKDIAGIRDAFDVITSAALKVKNNVAVARLGLGAPIAIKQAGSFPLYRAYVKDKYLMKAMVDTVIHGKEIFNMNEAFSVAFYKRRNESGIRDYAEAVGADRTERHMTGRKRSALEFIREAAMSPIKTVDIVTVATGMHAAVLQVLDEIQNGQVSSEILEVTDKTTEELQVLSSEERMVEAYKYADYATERTQPQFAPEHRSSLSRSKNMMIRFMTMFGGFTSQATNLTVRSIAEVAREGKGDGRGRKLAKALTGTIILAPLMSAAVNVLKGRPYDDDDDFAADLVVEWAFQVMGMPFFIRDATGNIRSLIKYGKAGGSPVGDVAQTLYETGQEIYKILTGKGSWKRLADTTAEFASLMSGMPYTQPRSLYKAIKKAVENDSGQPKQGTINSVYR